MINGYSGLEFDKRRDRSKLVTLEYSKGSGQVIHFKEGIRHETDK